MSKDLEISEHLAFQRGVWRVQRCGWVVLALLLLLAFAGLTGAGGPLSLQEKQTEFGRVVAPRIARQGVQENIRLFMTGRPGVQRVDLGAGFFDAFEIIAVHPTPSREAATPDGISLTIHTEGIGETSAALTVRPRSAGWKRFTLNVNGRGLPLSTFVLR